MRLEDLERDKLYMLNSKYADGVVKFISAEGGAAMVKVVSVIRTAEYGISVGSSGYVSPNLLSEMCIMGQQKRATS